MVNLNQIKTALLWCLAMLWGGEVAGHEKVHQQQSNCDGEVNIACANTVTSAFSPNGNLWRLWTYKQRLYYAVSKDNGRHFGDEVKVAIAPEQISSRGENRPKLGFDGKEGVYISWSKPLKKRFTALVRFTYSGDGGKTFIEPITVNNDNLEVGHSFNEMLVSPEGQVTLTWLDSREKVKRSDYIGSSLFRAVGNRGEQGFVFDNVKLADNTCQCCRIAMAPANDKQIAVMWRHIFGENIRDHAIMTFTAGATAPPLKRATFDQWQINGCPHQGPGLSIDKDDRYHMVWFNNGAKGKGLFYAYSDFKGVKQSKTLAIGDLSRQAKHAHVINSDKMVDIVWLESTNGKYQLLTRRSIDGGEQFAPATILATSDKAADRPFLLKANGKHFVSWHRPGLGHKVIAL